MKIETCSTFGCGGRPIVYTIHGSARANWLTCSETFGLSGSFPGNICIGCYAGHFKLIRAARKVRKRVHEWRRDAARNAAGG